MECEKELKTYVQKLQELLQDDEKIVTVTSFAKDFNISLKISKAVLHKYLKKSKQSKHEVAATYILSGLLKHDNSKAVFLVEDSDLEAKKNFFKAKPNEVLHSLQKSKIIDLNIIALVDLLSKDKIRRKALFGSVVGKNCVGRILKTKNLPIVTPSIAKGTSSFFTMKAEEEKAKTVEKPTTTKTKAKMQPVGSIANLFSKVADNSTKKSPDKGLEPTKTAKVTGLSAFFTKESKREKPDIKTEKNNDKKLDQATDVNVDSEEEKPVKIIKNEEKVKIETKENNKPKESKNSKRQRDKSEEKNSKRRKRIIQHDSDSDDIFENNEDVDVIERSDDEERSPLAVEKKTLLQKNRTRKPIDKTYMDEDGYLVTKTEYIFESASDGEVEAIPPEKPIISEVKKGLLMEEKTISSTSENDISPKKNLKGKKVSDKNQLTLMSFFQKK